MKPADLFRKLSALGLDPDQIAGVLELMDEEAEGRKEKARARWHKWNDKKDGANVSKRLLADANVSSQLTSGDARGENNLLTSKITGQEENKKESRAKALSDVEAFKADLMHDASSEQVEAFVKHRKAKNGQNSAYAAKLFRRDAAACSLSISEAIDMAVSRNWLTVKPEYLAGTRRGNGQGPPSKPLNAVETNMQRRIRRNEPESGRRDNGDAELLPPDQSELRRVVVDLGQAMRWTGGSGRN